MKKKDTIFSARDTKPGDFVFDAEVANVFDDMLSRSIPLYQEQQNLIGQIAQSFWQPDTAIIDLGCSTATTLIQIEKNIPQAKTLIGYDNSEPMLEKSRSNLAELALEKKISLRLCDLNSDLSNLDFSNASVVTLCWTLQFIQPGNRDRLIRMICNKMVNKGVLIVTDKILTENTEVNDRFIDFYHDFKRKNGYSEEEIAKKREALENILIPWRRDENIALFQRNGFNIAETFFQWHNFAGFIAIKTPE